MGYREYFVYSPWRGSGAGRPYHRLGEVMPKKRGAPNQIIVVDGQPKVAKVISRAEAMEKAELYIVKRLPRYLRKLHDLAMGVFAVKDTKEGPKIYTTPPDRTALEYLVNRGLGSLPQRHEVTGQAGGPMEILPWMPAGMLKQPDGPEVIEGHATRIEELSVNEADVAPPTDETVAKGED